MWLLIIALFTQSGELVSQRHIAKVIDEAACNVLGESTAASLSFKMRPMVVKYKCVTGELM